MSGSLQKLKSSFGLFFYLSVLTLGRTEGTRENQWDMVISGDKPYIKDKAWYLGDDVVWLSTPKRIQGK